LHIWICIWMITAKLLWILQQWSVHVYRHDIADSWLLKDDTEANEVTESGSEFHSVIVLVAKDFWNRVEAQRGILSFCMVVGPLTGLSHRTKSRWFIGTATRSFKILYRKVSRLMCLRSSRGLRWSCCNTCSPVMLICDPAVSPSLDSLQRITILDEMRIPYNASIFHAWPDKCYVGQSLQLLRRAFQIPFD